MADSILRLKVESQEYDNKLKRAAEGIQRYAEGCRKAGGTLTQLDDGVEQFVKDLGRMETTSRTAKGGLNEMTKSFTDLSLVYKKLTDEEKASPFGKALASSLDQLKSRIQQSKSDIDEVNASINGSGGLTGSLDALASKFGMSIEQLTKFGTVAGIATTAVNVAKDAFFQSESNIDEWGRTVEGAKGAYNTFLDTLNTGNWSQFFSNLETAIKGGRDLYDVLDRLGSIKSNNAAAIAIVQQQIAQLRLAKQNGENVDAQLKAATQRLAALQKQSVDAGKAAGNQTAFNVIRSGVNSVGGARVNDATIQLAVNQLMTGGQGQFDKFRRNRDILQQRGMVERTQTITDSQGGTYERRYKVFDINALSREQQKQYALAQAITEGETRIQKGIAAFAQAVNEGTSSAREQFRDNRYALQGSGGGGGGKGGTTTPAPPDYSGLIFNPDKAALAGAKVVESGPSSAFQYYKDAMAAQAPTNMEASTIKALEALNKAEGVTAKGKPTTDQKKDPTDQEMLQGTQTMISSLQGILGGIQSLGVEIPKELSTAIGFLQTITGIVGAIQSMQTVGTFLGIFNRGGMVPHAATGYYVPGSRYSGDTTPVLANAGELILNKSSQGNLASEIQSAESLVRMLFGYQSAAISQAQLGNDAAALAGGIQQTGGSTPYLTGEMIYLGLSTYLESSGRGELMTSRFK